MTDLSIAIKQANKRKETTGRKREREKFIMIFPSDQITNEIIVDVIYANQIDDN